MSQTTPLNLNYRFFIYTEKKPLNLLESSPRLGFRSEKVEFSCFCPPVDYNFCSWVHNEKSYPLFLLVSKVCEFFEGLIVLTRLRKGFRSLSRGQSFAESSLSPGFFWIKNGISKRKEKKRSQR